MENLLNKQQWNIYVIIIREFRKETEIISSNNVYEIFNDYFIVNV